MLDANFRIKTADRNWGWSAVGLLDAGDIPSKLLSLELELVEGI